MTIAARRRSRVFRGAPLLALCLGLPVSTLDAQQAPPTFDIDRAYLVEPTPFEPFYVTATRPLREALREGLVHEETPILVFEREAGRLALSTEQMSYHHVAQGDMAGEPWLVSF
ncbi:MAG: hypothetical protein ACE5PT_07885 [Gemmatimonadales bacterium]